MRSMRIECENKYFPYEPKSRSVDKSFIVFEKISNFKIMNILYIILKHVVWRFRIYNYFREVFKFRKISLSVHKIAKFEYFAKVIIYSKSPDHVL